MSTRSMKILKLAKKSLTEGKKKTVNEEIRTKKRAHNLDEPDVSVSTDEKVLEEILPIKRVHNLDERDVSEPTDEIGHEESWESENIQNHDKPASSMSDVPHYITKENSDSNMSGDDSDIDKDYEPEESESSEDESTNVCKLTNVAIPLTKKNTVATEKERASASPWTGAHSRKTRVERKSKRNTGRTYTTAKGKEVAARTPKLIRMCRMKCKEKLDKIIDEQHTVREKIFNEYWVLGDRNKRVAYVVSLVDSKTPATTRKRTVDPDKEKFRMVTHIFHFRVNGERFRVCRRCFMKTLDESQMFITLALMNHHGNVSGLSYDDKRGKTPPSNKHSLEKLQEIKDHISSFTHYKSHYTRRESSRIFLPSYLNLQVMYNLYCEGKERPVSRGIYEREFHKINLSFKQPKVDTCHKCDVLQAKSKFAANNTEKDDIDEVLAAHHAEADKAYLEKDKDKKCSSLDESMLCYTFDLQQCLPTPYLNTSVSFYKRSLWTYNLTMHETSTGRVACNMWHEAEGARGGNQIATCVFKELVSLPSNVKNVTLYSDTCGGQNKNSHVAAMFLFVMQENKNLNSVDHKFLVSGHSHMECDVDHGMIEKQKKKMQVPVTHPHDWYQLVRSVGKKNKFTVVELSHTDFLDFAGLLKDTLQLRKKDTEGNQVNWHNVRWFRFTKEYGTVLYKNSLEEDEPFKALSFIRRGKEGVYLKHKNCYNGPLAITKAKKKDLLELLPLIPPVFHNFYKELKTNDAAKDNYPDIDEFPGE